MAPCTSSRMCLQRSATTPRRGKRACDSASVCSPARYTTPPPGWSLSVMATGCFIPLTGGVRAHLTTLTIATMASRMPRSWTQVREKSIFSRPTMRSQPAVLQHIAQACTSFRKVRSPAAREPSHTQAPAVLQYLSTAARLTTPTFPVRAQRETSTSAGTLEVLRLCTRSRWQQHFPGRYLPGWQ